MESIMKRRYMLAIILIMWPILSLGNEANISEISQNPSYAIISHTTNLRVDRGDKYEMDIYLSGDGEVEESKILISIPECIVKDNITQLSYPKLSVYNNVNKSGSIHINTTSLINKSQPTRFFIKPNKIWFFRAQDDEGDKQRVGENDWVINNISYAPFNVDFVIAENAPTGDHTISAYFFYRVRNNWFQDKKDIIIHINHWYETGRYQLILTIISVITFIVILGDFLKILNNIYKWIKAVGGQ